MTPGNGDHLIDPAEVRAVLRRILDSNLFHSQASRSRFLEFIVEESLAGRSDRIKGTTIALEVYERGGDFDPQSDPIVRVEARKMRRDLEHYYLTAGVDEDIYIEVPKGGYVPSITRVNRPLKVAPRSQAPTDAENPGNAPSDDGVKKPFNGFVNRRYWPALAVVAVMMAFAVFALGRTGPDVSGDDPAPVFGPTLFVTPFLPASDVSREIALARGVTIETTNALTRFDDLKVYPVGPDYQVDSIDPTSTDVAFILSGTVQLVGDDVQLTAQLQQASDGLLVWSERYVSALVPDQIFEIQKDIAESVTKQLAEPFALLGELSRRQLATNEDASLFAYECVLKGYEYRATFDLEKHGVARDCLEEAVQTDPGYSRAWALLAYLYADEYRFYYNQRPEAYRRALDAGRKAVDLDPNDALSHQALSVALFGNGEIEAALEAGRKAIELNPYNTEALIQMGYRTYATGRWDEGVKLVEEAIAASPSPPAWYPWVLALYHYKQQDYAKARELAEDAGLPNLVLFEATRAAIYGQLGLSEEASRSLALVKRNDPFFDQRARQLFAAHHFPEDFLDSIMDGLAKANP